MLNILPAATTVTTDQESPQPSAVPIEGDDEWTRIQPLPPNTWGELAADIEAMRSRVPGNSSVLIGGHFRQAKGFFAGAVFRGARGYNLAAEQRDAVWIADAANGPQISPPVVIERDQGSADIAVVVNASAEGTPAVVSWLDRAGVAVCEVLSFQPAGGSGPHSLPDGVRANSFAVQVRDAIRQRLPGGRVHLFLVGPIALSVFLGHHWNRVAPTTVYEHLSGAEYVSAFDVSA